MFEIFNSFFSISLLHYFEQVDTKLTHSPCAVAAKFRLLGTRVLERAVVFSVNKINFSFWRHFAVLNSIVFEDAEGCLNEN